MFHSLYILMDESKWSQAPDAVYIQQYSFNICIMVASSGHVSLTNTHGLFRPEHCVQILKFPNEWHELENTQNNSVKIDEAPRLSVINVCHIRSFGNCFRLNLFQGIPGPVGIKGPKGRQVNALSFISCHQGILCKWVMHIFNRWSYLWVGKMQENEQRICSCHLPSSCKGDSIILVEVFMQCIKVYISTETLLHYLKGLWGAFWLMCMW